jgi:branched-chain amino acid transport system permease protein
MWSLTFSLEVLIGGALSGVMYSLIALGFVLIFKASGVFNFAQGALVLFAALTFVLLLEFGGAGAFWKWTAWLSLALAAVSAVLFVLPRVRSLPRVSFLGNSLGNFLGKRMEIVVAAVGVLVLLLMFGGDHNLWRAVFVTLLIFLTVAAGEKAHDWAAGILLALAALSLFASDFNFFRALALTVVVMVVLAMAIERAVLRPLVNQPAIILFMATIGLSFVLEGVAQGVWDADVHAMEIGIPDLPLQIAGIFISELDLYAAAIAGVLVAGLALFFTKTRVGRGFRAVADDHQAAMSVGIRLKTIWAIVWAAAGVAALVAGAFWGSKLGVQFSLALLAFKALPVLILGGFTSIPGAIVGGIIVGLVEKTFEVFVGIPLFGGGTESWSPYMLAVVFLMFRPQGLFGEEIIERV